VWQPDVSLLESEFQQIWDGEGGTFRVCDRIFFVWDSSNFNYWGHQIDLPPTPTVPPAPPVWWNDEPQPEQVEAWREANEWVGVEAIANPSQSANPVCELSKIADFNSPTNPRTIRATTNQVGNSYIQFKFLMKG